MKNFFVFRVYKLYRTFKEGMKTINTRNAPNIRISTIQLVPTPHKSSQASINLSKQKVMEELMIVNGKWKRTS
jgi:hypothetical protein